MGESPFFTNKLPVKKNQKCQEEKKSTRIEAFL